MPNSRKPKLKKLDVIIIAILIIGSLSLAVSLSPDEEISITRCGAGQYLDTDINTCILKSSIQPEIVIEEKIVEKIIIETTPMKVIRGLDDKQNIFIVDNGENPTVFLQHCNGLTILNNPVMTVDSDGSFTLRDSIAGMTIFIDKRSDHQYQITTVPYTGESVVTTGTELLRSDLYKLTCENEVVKKETTEDVFYYDVELSNNNTVLTIDGSVGKIVDGKRSVTGMIVLYQNGNIEAHMESFTINLSSSGKFFETIDVDGVSDSGKIWNDNKTYRVFISYDGDQKTRDFIK